MIGNGGCSLNSPSRVYDCCVTFLKISEINVPLQSRSFPSAGNPVGSGRLSKRCLKLTALYGTGQHEIGEFEVLGDECVIDHRLDYQIVPSDSSAITKLHVYVDEACSYGLTGHVTVDLKEFIEEQDSEVYLEYPLSSSSPRHRAAKLKIVVRCTIPLMEEDPDLDLERFLSDDFPTQSDPDLIPEESEIKHLVPGSDFGATQPNLDVLYPDEQVDSTQTKLLSRQSQSEIHLLKGLEVDLLGLNSKLKEFVAECAQTKSNFGQYRKERDSTNLKKSDLQAAIFFAAGVTVKQRFDAIQSASVCSQPLVENQGTPLTKNSLILLRPKDEESDVLPTFSPLPDAHLPEVVTLSEENFLGLRNGALSECPSSSAYSNVIESVQTSGCHGEERNQSCQQSRSACTECFVCAVCSSQGQYPITTQSDNPTLLQHVRSTLTSEESTSMKASSPSPKRSVTVVIRNVLGVLLVAGVSFMLGAKVGPLGFKRDRTPLGAEQWGAVHQMKAWKETVISEMGNLDNIIGGPHSSEENQPNIALPLLASKISPPDRVLDNKRGKTALGSDSIGGTNPVASQKVLIMEASKKDHAERGKDSDRYYNPAVKEIPKVDLIEQVVSFTPLKVFAPYEPDDQTTGGPKTLVKRYRDSGYQDQVDVLRWRKMLKGTKAGLHEDTGVKI